MLPQVSRIPTKEMQDVMRTGARVSGGAMTLVYRLVPTRTSPRFAFIVSTKVDKRAVYRNRVKRLMREAVGHQMPTIHKPINGVFVARRAAVGLSQAEIEGEVTALLHKIGAL